MSLFDAYQELSPTTLADCLPRRQIMDTSIRPMYLPIVRRAGPAYTVHCGAGDHLMLHAALYRAPAGSVIVVEAEDDDYALAGGNVCAIALRRGIAAFVLGGAVRDVAEIRALGFPVYAKCLAAKGAAKERVAALNDPVVCGGVRVGAGDIIVADEEGIVVVPQADVGPVLAAARKRDASEAAQTLESWESDHRRKIDGLLAAKGFKE